MTAAEEILNMLGTRFLVRRAENVFTRPVFPDIQVAMCHFVTIELRQLMTRLGGPVEDVAR